MMKEFQVRRLLEDLQAKYFQGYGSGDFEAEAETYGQIEILTWILGDVYGKTDGRAEGRLDPPHRRARKVSSKTTGSKRTNGRNKSNNKSS